MLFKRPAASFDTPGRSLLAQGRGALTGGKAPRPGTPPSTPAAPPGVEAALAAALDALGRVLEGVGAGGFDIPERSAETLAQLTTRFRDHVVAGRHFTDEVVDPPVPLEARQYAAVAEFLVQHKAAEKAYVEAALADLRDALWACVNRVQAAVAADVKADAATGEQVHRVHSAINKLETGTVKQEVLSAMNSMEQIASERRATQTTQFGALAARIDQLGSQLEVLKKENETDILTGLGNRKRFDAALARAMQMGLLSRQPLTLVMLDMDGLKEINDSFGHPAGDAALRVFSDCLAKVFLRSTDVICRIGGDEFAVILPNTEARVVARMAARLVTFVAETPVPQAPGARMGVSVGYSGLKGGETPEAWVARTDAALYSAKRAGKGQAVSA